MSAQRYDYAALKTQFLAAMPAISIDELCRRNGIEASKASSIHRRAKNEGWLDLREKALVKVDDKLIDQISTLEAKRRLRRLQVQDNAIDAIDESISKMRADMKRTRKEKDPETGEYHEVPAVTYRPEQVVQLIDRIEKLFDDGSPADPNTNPAEARNLTQINFNDFNPDDEAHRHLAAEIVERTRGSAGARGRAAGASPLPSAPGSLEDQ